MRTVFYLFISLTLFTSSGAAAPPEKTPELALSVTLQSSVYQPAKTQGHRLAVTVENTGKTTAHCPHVGYHKGIRLMAQPTKKHQGFRHQQYLELRNPFTLPLIRVAPGEKRVVFEVELSRILPTGSPAFWKRFKPMGWMWTWAARGKPPLSPIHTSPSAEAQIDGITLWAELTHMGQVIKSKPVQLKIKYGHN